MTVAIMAQLKRIRVIAFYRAFLMAIVFSVSHGVGNQVMDNSKCDPGQQNYAKLDDAGPTPPEAKTSQLIQRLLIHMDPRIRPGQTDKPVKVTIDCHVISLGSISEVRMDYTADILLRQRWRDVRLAYNRTEHPYPIALTHGVIKQIWTPDIFFPNEIDAKLHDVTVPNELLKIYPNGSVEYGLRVTLKTTCPMDLRFFPMDSQECQLKLESFSYEETDLLLEWTHWNPVTIDTDMKLPEMELTHINTSRCLRVYKTGSFHCLSITFRLERHYGYYILQTYLPSMLITVLSWVSFWIHKEAVPARISLGVTTVLTMTTQLSGSKSDIPKVSYPKAIDVWMSVSMLFVFSALLEYAIVNAMMRVDIYSPPTPALGKPQTAQTNDTGQPNNGPGNSPLGTPTEGGTEPQQRLVIAGHMKAQHIDNMARIGFPSCFVLFNILYWTFYLGQSSL